PPENDPWKAFDRIFGDLGADPLGVQEQTAKRHHVLDRTLHDYKNLLPKLSPSDKAKVDNHLTTIEGIAKRLDAPAAALRGACQLPPTPPPIDISATDDFPAISDLQIDLMVMALACDLTRVGSLFYATVHNGKTFTWLNQTDSHHALSHAPSDDLSAHDQ